MRRALRLGATAAASLAVAYAVLCVWAADRYTRVVRQAVTAAPSRVGPVHEAVAFRTADGLTLRGWWFPSAGGRAVVLVHGKDANRGDEVLLDLARALHARGYGVLAFDLRGHGESDGDRFSLGQHERHDVAAAIDHVAARGIPPGRTALVGISLGAGAALQALHLREVGAAVADSAYANGIAIVDEASPGATGFPAVFTPGIVAAARVLLGLDAYAVDPDRAVARSRVPLLIVHCEGDTLIGPHHARLLHEARPDAEVWLVPGCGHAGARSLDPAAYDARVIAFLDRALR